MSSTPAAPNTPQAPSLSDQIGSYVSSLPALYSAQQQYAPQLEQQNLQLEQQYAPQFQALQQSLYPQLTALQNQLTQTAATNSTGQMPDYMKAAYQDQFRGQLGDQNQSGIGADYVSRNMLNQQQQYNQYYQNMGMSLIGQQPLYQASQAAPTFSPMQTYAPSQALSYGANTYGSYASGYASMYGSNAQLQGSLNSMYGQAIGGIAGGAGNYFGSKQLAGSNYAMAAALA